MRKLLGPLIAASFVAGPAFAADMHVKAPLHKAPPPYSWTGWYIGGNVGWKGVSTNMSSAPNDAATVAFNTACITAGACPQNYGSSSGSGVLGGGQIGYNWQLPSSWVIGLEADFQGSHTTASTAIALTVPPFVPFTGSNSTTENWLGTVRARAGILVTPMLLAYGTGGLAYSSIGRTWTGSFAAPSFSSWSGSGTSTLTGWTIGGGLEWAVGNGWTVGAEYLNVRLRGGDGFLTTNQAPACVANCTFRITGADVVDNIVRAKVNYKFSR
jgi:outer membrane immunogenic protein